MAVLADYIINIVFAFLATMCFSVAFNTPRKELPFCGLCGMVSRVVFHAMGGGAAACLSAVLAAACLCRVFSYWRKTPSTVYLAGAVIPLVPGPGVYNTMYEAINGDTVKALANGIDALKTAGVLALGIMIVFTLPARVFDLRRWRRWR